MPRKQETNAKYITVTASINREMNEELVRITKANNISKSEFIRRALRNYIDSI